MDDFLLRRRAAFDPPRFQGWGRRRRYFEGWYFKVVVPEHELAYAFIPGISYDEAGEGHSFLQVLDGVKATADSYQYTTVDFRSAAYTFDVQLGPHRFATDRLLIDLPDLQVDLRFDGVTPWPKRLLAPGIMGWYSFVPRMQCYHGLVSFHHRTLGSLKVGNRTYDASSGVGYTEKDWGSGFPEAWIWGQSNHLSDTRLPANLMLSVAVIPWLKSSFRGFLCTLLLDGELYTFTTWSGARVDVRFAEGGSTVTLVFTRRRLRLTVTGHPATGGHLAVPVGGAMTGKIHESLQARLAVRLERGNEVVYEGTASWAGLEVSENAREMLGSES
ncbi:hypothetical protein GGR26_000228 [Lewinella marina]|uniref:Tocopherol cyclase n=1 Tax=Neolewinella marina TaxID=438751 RepID=A0A2G0CK30_9BACT|nr:tocopherol cyclase family protein [Neolewinella marina]NJB84483.1 hypothetical protein [Neolewinella marina]PHL00325.1 hypothetical protein CGL56_04645 [Neolewinella marina]